MSNKSDFTHHLETYEGREVIAIEDLNLGNMTVTNNIENVVDCISKMEHINPANFIVVYNGTDGYWDGWDVIAQKYVLLSEDTWKDAVTKYIQMQFSQCHS